MTDDELAMAYADGELDAISAKRFEKRMAAEPDLAAAVDAHRALRTTLERRFAPIAEEPVPDRFAAMLDTNVTPLRPRRSYWQAATAMAACLVGGIVIGQIWQPGPGVPGTPLVASGPLARALDQQLAGADGPTRILASFRDSRGQYCRVFQGQALDGIACHDVGGWSIERTQASDHAGKTDYRQAGSGSPDLLAAAQSMMAGDPLDPAAERAAQAGGWK